MSWKTTRLSSLLLAASMMTSVISNVTTVIAEEPETTEDPVEEVVVAETVEETPSETVVEEAEETVVEEIVETTEEAVVEEIIETTEETVVEEIPEETVEEAEVTEEEEVTLAGASVTSIVANTYQSDGDRMVESFVITVDDASILTTITKDNFDIKNNYATTCYADPATGEALTPMSDDGIEISVEGATLTMTMNPFKYGADLSGNKWSVESDIDGLSFTAADLTKINTKTLDDFVRGEYTYAGITRKYALYMPKNASGPVPIVIWNHGGGEYGVDIEQTLTANRGATAWIEAGYETAVLMIQVSNANYSYGAAKSEAKKSLIDQNNALQAALVKDLIAEGKVDADRVYVAGCSSGGGATMRFVMQNPDLVAAAIPMCSMDPIVSIHNYSLGGKAADLNKVVAELETAFQSDVYQWDSETNTMVATKIDTEALVNVPLYFTHAEKDGTCQVTSSLAYKQALDNLGAKKNLIKVFSNDEMAAGGVSPAFYGGGLLHWSWVPVLNDTSADGQIAWLFKQSKPVIQSVVANTFQSDGDRMVESFTIKVNDPSVLNGITKDNFDIKNNYATTCYADPATGEALTPMSDDGIEISVDGATLTMTMNPFKYGADLSGNKWSVESDIDGLSFTAADLTKINTKTLDDFVRGEYTYAGITRKYALYMPKNASGPVPIVIWNHGGGEYGVDIEQTLTANRGATAWIEAGYETAVLMIQVSNANYSYGAAKSEAKKSLIDQNNALQAALVKDLIAEGKVDADRVYVAGCSSGGGATMRFVMQNPDLVAAAIPMCSMDPIVSIHNYSVWGSNPTYEEIVADLETAFQSDVYQWDSETNTMVATKIDTEALVNVPLYFTHAENDGTCQVTSSLAYKEALDNLGAKKNLIKVFSDEEMIAGGISPAFYGGGLLHWSWVPVLNDTSEDGQIAWLFSHNKLIDSYKTGVEVTENTDFPKSEAVNQATFTWVNDGTYQDVTKVVLSGNFQFYYGTQAERDLFDAGESAKVVTYSPYEYKKGMHAVGYDFTGNGFELVMDEIADGIYQITMPVPSGEYCYGFQVTTADGNSVRELDPANIYDVNPDNGHSSNWSLLFAGNADNADVIEGQEKVFPRTDDKKGTNTYVAYTALDGSTQYLNIYLPYGYSSEKTYPTLYISHGGGGNETEWMYLGGVQNIFDNLIAENEVDPTVVVAMDNTYFGWDDVKVNDNLMKNIIPFVESNYSVGTTPETRAFAGLSMGGGVATRVFKHDAADFGYIGIWSGTYPDEVKNVENKNYPMLMLSAGCFDMAKPGFPLVKEIFDEEGVKYTYYEPVGAHNWETWRDQLTVFAKDYLWTKDNAPLGVTVDGHDVSFGFEDTDPRKVEKVTVSGNFQWALKSESDQYVAMADNENMKQFRAEDFTNYDEMYNENGLHGLEEYEMKLVNGERYELTITVPGNLYYYDYNVYYTDGTMETIRDPYNLSESNPADGKDAGHSLVYVGSPTDTEPGQEYVYPRTDGKVGTREYIPYKDINGKTAYLEVYLPYGYDESKTYPVVYVSHGGGGNEAEWMTIGAAANIFDNLIAEGKLEPTIMVTMDNNVLNWGDVSQKNTIEKVIPFIEKMYSVSKKVEDRAFCGLSMGSMMTNGMAMNYPEYFGYLGSFSGGSQDLDESKYNVTELNNTVLYLTAGCVDMAYNNKMGISSLDYMAMYDKLGVNYTFDLLYGAHDWKVWRESLTNFAKDYLWTVSSEKAVTVSAAETTYNGKVQTPKLTVTVDGKATTDYTVVSTPSAKDAGAYNVVVKVGERSYTAKWVIHKADQVIRLTSPKKAFRSYTKTYKYSKVKKSSKSFRLKFAGNQTTVRKISGSAALSYNTKTQKVTVKKGTKKGTYFIRLNAPETKNYGGSNAITIIVKVK